LQFRLHDVDALSSAQLEAWDGLLLALPVRSPFLSAAFCQATHAARGGGRVLHISADDGTSGFLPFQLRAGRSLLGHAEKPGGGLSDMFGIVGTIRTVLDDQALLRSAKLSSLRFDHAVDELCPFAFGDRERTSGIRVRVDDYSRFVQDLARADEQFVGMVAAGERRLAKKFGKIRFDWHSADASVELDRIIEVKREQYRRTGVADGLAQDWQRKLLHSLLGPGASALCRPVLSTLYAGDDWVASHLALTCADTFHIWFPAYDARFGRYGPGHMLLFKMLEQGVREGFRWFDFGQGDAMYKSRYQGETYALWKGVVRRRNIIGYSERVLQSLKWRARRAKRSLAQAAPEARDRGADTRP
jgi:CelD/BcsL family acetyltransferase involved in cellulose biosynthesis